jgi:uridine kinase
MIECVRDLKGLKSAEIPIYSFVKHQRLPETQYLYGGNIIIVEGIFVLHDPVLRNLLDLKIFVQCDSDLMLARRIKRDTVERGRDVAGSCVMRRTFPA